MEAWTNATPPPRPAGVILRPDRFDRALRLQAVAPAPRVAAYVERYWALEWDLPPGRRETSSLVPQLSVNLTHETGRTRPEVGRERVVVTGVPTRRFDADLHGAGHVFGIKFHPGAFAGLMHVEVGALADRTVPAGTLLAAPMVRACNRLYGIDDAPMADELLSGLVEGADPAWTHARDAVALVEKDPEIVSVEGLARRCGRSPRTLQRLFARYIGLSPKQVVTRFRLRDAVAALDGGEGEGLADLALRLGFFDQAHLTREFTRFVGISPSRYRAGERVRP